MRLALRTALAVTLVSGLGVAGSVWAQTVKGIAVLGILQPVTKVEGNDVVTTIKVKNLSKGPIAGLKVDEFWYDKKGNPLPGGSKQLSQPLAAGAVATMVVKTRKDPQMDRNSYQFTHENGQVRTRLLAKLE